jgi:peroxiredoxin/YHS domain-containing protein
MIRCTIRPAALALAAVMSCAAAPRCVLAASGHALAAPPTRAATQYNLADKALAASGYDVVAYFPEGGGKPVKGSKEFEFEHAGARYRFSSRKNLDAFKANPDRYEPAFGGWCAYAMADGDKVEVDPESFLISNNRLFLFYKGFLNDTRSKWLKQPADLESKADAAWTRLTGEQPRRAGVAAAPQPLAPRLAKMKDDANTRLPADVRDLYERNIKAVAADPAIASALKVGDTAPDFDLPDARGGTVSLKALRAKGPVVLAWYRGGWCPYCNLELRALQERLADFTAAGATLVAISPQAPDGSLSTAEKNGLAFPVLTDAGNAVARRYGIAYTLPAELQQAFKGKLDLATINANAPDSLPVSATYVVAPDGRILFAHVDADYRTRAEPEEVLKAVRQTK